MRRNSRTSAEATGYRCKQPGTYRTLLTDRTLPLSWIDPRPLWRSRNDKLVRWFGDPTNDLRRRWIKGRHAAGVPSDFTIRDFARRDSVSFVVMGDTGEGDGSQYALVPCLLEQAGESDFMVICSDVIYPAGGIDEYEDKFYRAYRDYPAPIYAVPGNHDWYDELTGFMFHFCGAPWEERPRNVQGPGPGWKRFLRRALWRRPPRGHAQALERMQALRSAPEQRRVQPGPYMAIEAGPFLLVGIDSGITGEIDRDQGAWLHAVSQGPKPKILLTGKPLYVDGEIHPGLIEGGGTVLEIVEAPEHGYIAAIGGDIHNYQRYPVRFPDGRTIQYIVSGAGGAFMNGTHRIKPVALPGVSEAEFRCYPLRGDSLWMFCRNYGRLFSGGVLGRWLLIGRLLGRLFELPPNEVSAFVASKLGAHTTRSSASAIKISLRTRLVANWISPLWGQVHGLFQPIYSELLDWNDPPMFKSLLRVDGNYSELAITCFAATGCLEHELEPPIEDTVHATRTADGRWSWADPDPNEGPH
jgi:hypothetical protein